MWSMSDFEGSLVLFLGQACPQQIAGPSQDFPSLPPAQGSTSEQLLTAAATSTHPQA